MTIIKLMPFSVQEILAICRIMTAGHCAVMVYYAIQIVQDGFFISIAYV